MRTVTCRIEIIDGRAWARLSSSRAPGSARIAELLRWMVEQLHLGNFDDTVSDDGSLTSLVLGSAAAPPVDDAGLDDIAAHAKDRALSVSVAGIFAKSREEGVEPQHAAFVKRAHEAAAIGAHDNTSLHYALELVEVLDRIEKVSFVFDSPPIKTRAAPGVILLLREATRAYLFGLSRSCVCVCRALLEAALRERVSDAELRDERVRTKKGDLESLISIAERHHRLPSALVLKAHAIRRAGNQALHGTRPNDERAWEFLQDTRAIVTALYLAA